MRSTHDETLKSAIEYWDRHALDKCDHVLLLPDADEEWKDKVVVAFKERTIGKCTVILEECSDLLLLYSLYEFTDKIIIGSLDFPHGRKLRNLLDSGIATEDELINDVILGALNGADI